MRLALFTALLLVGAGPAAHAQTRHCAEGSCEVRLTPAQLLAGAEKLVATRRYDEALPLIAHVPFIP